MSWYALFVIFYLGIAALQWNRLVIRDKIMAVLVSTGGIFATVVVVDQIGYSFVKGLSAIKHPNFWTQDMANAANAGPHSGLNVGGILHAAVGSLEQLALATLFSVPLGITAAVFLAEVGGRFERPVRTIVNAMTALPSIIAGLVHLRAGRADPWHPEVRIRCRARHLHRHAADRHPGRRGSASE